MGTCTQPNEIEEEITMKNTNNTNTLTVVLIKGRHEIPVSQYIFENAIEDVHNYEEIGKHILDFLINKVGIKSTYGSGINQNDYTDVEVWQGTRELVVYVTGLTCVTAELIKLCAYNGVRLTLMNFDSVSGEYKAQRIF